MYVVELGNGQTGTFIEVAILGISTRTKKLKFTLSVVLTVETNKRGCGVDLCGSG
jgi:hypothetical protein